MEDDEHAPFPPLPGDCHPSAGHPLPDLRPHPRLPARQHQRDPDRALPPGPPRSARHPIPVTGPRLRPAGDSAADVCQLAAELPADLGPPVSAITQRGRCSGGGRAKSRRSASIAAPRRSLRRAAISGQSGPRLFRDRMGRGAPWSGWHVLMGWRPARWAWLRLRW